MEELELQEETGVLYKHETGGVLFCDSSNTDPDICLLLS